MSRRARFYSLGNVSIDDLVFADSTTMWCVPGGNAIYSALGMAVWGRRPDVIAPIGPEYPIAKLGERISLCRCRPIERTLRNWGLYEEDGTRHFTFRSKTRNWIDFSPTVSDLDEGPYAFCHLAPLPWDLHMEFATNLRAKGANLISVDPDDRRLHEVPLPELARLLRLVDMFMPSRQDIAAIFPGRPPLDALKALRELSPDTPIIIVKCGAAGAIGHQSQAADYLEAPSAAERAVDETGAGDAFCGGAMVGYSRRFALADALTHATVSASFAVEAMGPAALVSAPPDVAEQRHNRITERIEARRL
jgi:sugar/nucleoside kinase (ribokinase family)